MASQTVNPKDKSRWGILGGIIAAIGASICCIGPLVLLALGIGGAWVSNLAAFEAFRPYFIGITILFLGYAFYRVYRPSRAACEPGSACAHPTTRKTTKMMLWIVTMIALGLIAFPYLAPGLANAGQQSTTAPVQTETAILKVNNMTCSGCALTAQQSLASVDGVIDARVSFEDRQAVVKYDPRRVKPQDLETATSNVGYPSEIIKREESEE